MFMFLCKCQTLWLNKRWEHWFSSWFIKLKTKIQSQTTQNCGNVYIIPLSKQRRTICFKKLVEDCAAIASLSDHLRWLFLLDPPSFQIFVNIIFLKISNCCMHNCLAATHVYSSFLSWTAFLSENHDLSNSCLENW